MSVVSFSRVDGGIAVVSIDFPPVNALGAAVRRGLDTCLRELAAAADVRAIVLTCAGRTFSAGADISEFGKPMERPNFDEIMAIIENGRQPVIAAIHGTALGGGYEFALMCHYRIAVPSARVGLPEVTLGLLPAGGGTQRLPRIVGVAVALELITSGRHVPAAEAFELGMVDALAGEGRLREDAIAFAQRVLAEGQPLLRVRDRTLASGGDQDPARVCRSFLQQHSWRFRGELAPFNIVKAIQSAAELGDFDAGLHAERELMTPLWHSAQAAARRYFFYAEREAARAPPLPPGTPIPTREQLGIVDAGTDPAVMGAALRRAGLDVSLHVPEGSTRLLEIAAPADTAPPIAAALLQLAKPLGRVPVLARPAPEPPSARLRRALRDAAEAQVAAGRTPEAIDRALILFGFNAGPFGTAEPAVRGSATDGEAPDPALIAQLFAPVVNAGARLLEAGDVARASDLDVTCVLGLGWPVHCGGPMCWADQQGLAAVVAQLQRLQAQHGDQFRPALLLEQQAAAGQRFTRT